MKKVVSLGFLAIASIVLLAGCEKKENEETPIIAPIVIENNDIVTISYSSTLAEATPESIEKDIQKVITIGQEEIFNVFDQDLLGKKIGDRVEKVLKGDKIYRNEYSDGKIQNIPAQVFADTELTIGQKVDLGEMKGFVTNITDEFVTIDMNPNYLDKDIQFDITITNIEKKKSEENIKKEKKEEEK